MRSYGGPALSVLAITGAALAGVGVAWNPAVLGVALAPAILAALVRWSTARLMWFVVGGLAVFQGDGIGAPKLGYLLGVVLVAALSTVRLCRSREEWLKPFRPILPAALATGVGLLCSLLIAHGRASTSDSIRDLLPYLLLVVAPIIGLDASHDLGETTIAGMNGTVGVFAAAGFALDWLNRRGVSALPVGRLFLASQILAGFGFAFSIGMAAGRRQRVRWALASVFTPTALLLTGTRSTLLMGVAVLGVVGTRRKYRLNPPRALLAVGAGLGTLIWIVPRVAARVTSDQAFFGNRLSAAMSALNGGLADDGSYRIREVSYAHALTAWREHPWLGTGPGYLFNNATFVGDTPVATLSKFGVVGVVGLALFLSIMVITGMRAGRTFGWSPVHNGVRAFILIVLATIPFGSPVEDKGFSFAACLGVCALGAAARSGAARICDEAEALERGEQVSDRAAIPA